jgi:integrase/recombinase XerD
VRPRAAAPAEHPRKTTSENQRVVRWRKKGERLARQGVYAAITKWAEKAGLHNPHSHDPEEHFSPHCFRHWFTTQLLRAGTPREYVKELRGDARKDAIDIYNHIGREELRKAYLAHIPLLGV